MKLISRIGMLTAALALTVGAGCSKSDSDAAKDTKEVSAKDVAGIAKETLLVLKFHHDS